MDWSKTGAGVAIVPIWGTHEIWVKQGFTPR